MSYVVAGGSSVQSRALAWVDREHHDQNAPRHSAWGPRLYTFFMFLSEVEQGGETVFPRLNVSVAPKKVRLHAALPPPSCMLAISPPHLRLISA